MKFSLAFGLLFVLCFFGARSASAQVDSITAQITSSSANTFVRDINGSGRFVVFESNGDIATERSAARNNADGNTEIFLFDYAQRRVFQITNTRRVLINNGGSATDAANIQVDISNTRPVIANQLVNNELWIAFSSNATTSVGGMTPTGTNPGNFDGTALSNADRTQVIGDGNTEIWLYRVLITTPVINLSSGIEPPFNDLSAGTFLQVTNTLANTPSQPASSGIPAFVSDDNRDVTINDTASTLAFVSNRDLVTGGNADANGEVFVYARSGNAGSFQQITQTPRSNANGPIFNQNPSLSGDGSRMVFFSNAATPRPSATVTNGDNADNNGEVFYVNLAASPIAFTQITRTTRTNPSDAINLLSAGRRISRDGRYVGFESSSNNPGSNGALQAGYQVYVFDANASTYTAVGPRSDADPGVPASDVRRFPTFSTTVGANNSTAPVVIFASRLNFTPAGVVPTTASDGLNPDAVRQIQIYSFPLGVAMPTITRISRFPIAALSEVQPYASDTRARIAFNIPRELGAGNNDFTSEAFYLLTPVVTTETQIGLSLFTGASALPVATPSASPTPTPSPSPSPTPQTAAGLSPSMIGIARLASGSLTISQTATGASNARRFPLPVELGGVTLSINNVAAGIYSVDAARGEVRFVAPAGLAAGTYPIVLNDNGRVARGTVVFVAAQPDIFRKDNVAAGGGRARIFNATTGVALQGEPFPIRSIRLRGGYNIVQTRLRVFLTGVQDLAAGAFTIQIGSVTVPAASILTGAVATDQPGVYTIDFLLPPETRTLGDVPIVISVGSGSTAVTSRLGETASRIRILP